MYYAVAKGGSRNEPALGLVNVEANICARGIGLLPELVLELEKIVFQVIFKPGHDWIATFAFGGVAKGEQQVVPGSKVFKPVVMFQAEGPHTLRRYSLPAPFGVGQGVVVICPCRHTRNRARNQLRLFSSSAGKAYPAGISGSERSERNYTKTDVVVAVVRIVPVAVRATDVVIVIVERAAPKNTVLVSRSPLPAGSMLPPTQKLADFVYHGGYMLILSLRKPFPSLCKP